MTGTDGPTLTAIETELGSDGVWVAPDMHTQVPPEAEAQIEQAVAGASKSFYVVVAELDRHDPLIDGSPALLAGIIQDDTGLSGTYISTEAQSGEPYELEVNQRPEQDYGLYQAARIARLEHPDDLAASIVTVIELVDSGANLDARWEQAQQDHPELYQELYGYLTGDGTTTSSDTDSRSSDTDSGSGVVVGVVSALIVAAVGAATIAVLRRRRGRAGPLLTASTRDRPLALPETVLRAVRAAEDERNATRAQAEVLALGEAIDAADLTIKTDRARTSWQAALDHYDVASRILDRAHSPADAVGVIVLAERGGKALAAAVRGRGWEAAKGCYFNPLHGLAAETVTWTGGDRSVRVPACRACSTALQAGREPDDVLDFVVDGRPLHYFRLDLGAWSRTGYGALEPDLLGGLLRSPSASRP